MDPDQMSLAHLIEIHTQLAEQIRLRQEKLNTKMGTTAAASTSSPVTTPAPSTPSNTTATVPPSDYTENILKRRKTSKITLRTIELLKTQNRFYHFTDTTPEEPENATPEKPETPQNTPESPATPPKTSVPPPLRDKDNWTQISKYLRDQKVHFTKATNARDGINLYTANEDQYRTMYKALESIKTPFHTIQLRSEKSLRVVLRGVVQSLTTEQIQSDLLKQNYETIKITRLNGRDNKPAPLVMVELDKKYKSIFNLETCCGLTVKVESKKLTQGLRQCHKCQLFGHSQPNCHANYRCMKCAGPHSTHECTKPKTLPAKCANCSGEHTSIFSNCPNNPNKNASAAPTPSTSHIPTRPTSSYSSAVRGPQPTPPPTPIQTAQPSTSSASSFGSILGEMLTTLLASNPSTEQITHFVQHSQQLYKLYTQK